jgi:hypothetical protein
MQQFTPLNDDTDAITLRLDMRKPHYLIPPGFLTLFDLILLLSRLAAAIVALVSINAEEF